MSNVVRFPGGHRVAARSIPRQEFERLAELALDVVQRIVTLLDDADDRGTDERCSAVPLSLVGSEREGDCREEDR